MADYLFSFEFQKYVIIIIAVITVLLSPYYAFRNYRMFQDALIWRQTGWMNKFDSLVTGVVDALLVGLCTSLAIEMGLVAYICWSNT